MATSEAPRRAGDIVGSLFEGELGRGLSDSARAARAWYAANGDRERAHTTGVWVRRARRAGERDQLTVALDSGLFALELSTNKDIYLTRLEYAGLSFQDIRFTVQKGSGPARRGAGARKKPEVEPLAELTDAEREAVERATRELPDGLRQSVSRAMCASLRREKTKTSRNS